MCAYVTDTPTKVQMIFNVIRCSDAGYGVPIITRGALKMAVAGVEPMTPRLPLAHIKGDAADQRGDRLSFRKRHVVARFTR